MAIAAAVTGALLDITIKYYEPCIMRPGVMPANANKPKTPTINPAPNVKTYFIMVIFLKTRGRCPSPDNKRKTIYY